MEMRNLFRKTEFRPSNVPMSINSSLLIETHVIRQIKSIRYMILKATVNKKLFDKQN